MTPTRDQWHAAMVAHLCGELVAADEERLQAHLAANPEERAHLESLAETMGTLDTLTLPAPPANLAARLIGNLSLEASTAHVTPTPDDTTHEEPSAPPLAEVVMIRGGVRRSRRRNAPWETVLSGDRLTAGEALEVGGDARALLRLPDKSELWVNANTLLHFARKATQTFVSLVRGEMLALVAKQRKALPIVTPAGTVHVLGTAFDTDVKPDGKTRVSVLEGEVEFSNRQGKQRVPAKRRIDVERGKRPPTVKRLQAKEVARVAAWSKPMLASSEATHRIAIRSNGKGQRMSTAKALIGLVIAGGIGGFAYYQWGMKADSPAPPDFSQMEVQETFTPGMAQPAAEASSDQTAEIPTGAVRLWEDQTPGLTWTIATRVQNSSTVNGLDVPADMGAIQQDMTMRVRAEVLDRTPEGNARIQMSFEDFDIQMVVNGQAMDLEQQMAQMGDDNPLNQLRGQSFVMTTSPTGQVLDTDMNLDIMGVQGNEGSQLMQRVMMSAATGFPEQPMSPGDQWTRDVRIPGSPPITAHTTNTLVRIDTEGDQQIAVVQRHFEVDLATPMTLAEMQQGQARISTMSNRLQMTGDVEQRLNIATGRYVIDRTIMEMAMDMLVRITPANGQVQQMTGSVTTSTRSENVYSYDN